MFEGYDQQDSQELLLTLMDGLHEDLNKVSTVVVVEVFTQAKQTTDSCTFYYTIVPDVMLEINVYQKNQAGWHTPCTVSQNNNVKFFFPIE